MPLRSQFDTDEAWLDHLRIWFAGQALAGMCAKNIAVLSEGTALSNFDTIINYRAAEAYKYADAMIAQSRQSTTRGDEK